MCAKSLPQAHQAPGRARSSFIDYMHTAWDRIVAREHAVKSASSGSAMLSYIMIGANDIRRSERFYTAILSPLGYECRDEPDLVIYSLPGGPDRYNGPGAVYVKKPYDGRVASFGNGTMFAFRAATQKLVRDIHAAGLAAGGSDEGAPGFRDE